MLTRALAATLVTIALTACGDVAKLPTDPDRDALPKLAANDGLRILTSVPEGAVDKCRDLASPGYVLAGSPAVVCLPIAPHATGITRIEVRGIQSQWDEEIGSARDVEIFHTLIDESMKESPLLKGEIRFPRIDPNGRGRPGAARLLVTLVSEDNQRQTFGLETQVRTLPIVEISEPAAMSSHEAGETLLARSRVRHASGVPFVHERWSGVVESGPLKISLPNLPADTVLEHAIYIPDGVEAGELVLELTAAGAGGETSGTVTRTFLITAFVPDLSAPVIEILDSPGPRISRGDSLTIRASDPSGLSRIGYVLLDSDRETILLSRTFTAPGETQSVLTVALDLPPHLSHGVLYLVPFARDLKGNEGWMAGTEEPGVPLLAQADPVRLLLLAGRLLNYPDAPRLTSIAYHTGRATAYFTDQFGNRVLPMPAGASELAFGTPITVRAAPSSMDFVRDESGAETDLLVVANQGGNELSLLHLGTGVVTTQPIPGVLATVEESLYPTLSPPRDVRTGCANSLCTEHRVYVTGATSASAPYSVIRSFPLQDGTIDVDLMDVVTPPNHLPVSSFMTLETVGFHGGRMIRADETMSVGRTIHTGPGPVIGLPDYPNAPLVIAQREGASILPGGSHIFVADPTLGWDGTGYLASRYTRVPNESIRDMRVNSDGSMVAFATGTEIVLVDDLLEQKARITESGSGSAAPRFFSFLQGHRASLSAAEGGLLAVARWGEDFVDIYETRSFLRVAEIPVIETFDAPFVFVRRGPNGVFLIGRTASGVMVVESTISDLIR